VIILGHVQPTDRVVCKNLEYNVKTIKKTTYATPEKSSSTRNLMLLYATKINYETIFV
jgi:hypothetical protein